MKYFLAVVSVMFVLQVNAQERLHKLSIGLNPLTLAEPHTGLGPAIDYQVKTSFSVFAEAVILFRNTYSLPDHWKNFKGMRFVLQPRFFTGPLKKFYITPEVRYKNYRYTENQAFISNTPGGTFISMSSAMEQHIIGGAFILGKRAKLSRNGKLYLDASLGLGGMYRRIHLKSKLQGYSLLPMKPPDTPPFYERNRVGYSYLPGAIRLMWRIH